MIPRGSLLNAAAVLVGALIGWVLGSRLDASYREIALWGLGLVTVGIGIKMFLASKNVLVVAAAIGLGGILGLAMGIQAGLEGLAGWIQSRIGASGDDQFVPIVVSTTILFSVGPMTLLGCIQERIEGKIELLALKSTMDGIAAIFFAAASGAGVVATAFLVLVLQSLLTWAAKPLKPIAENPDLLAEMSGAGGAMLVGTGLGLLEIKAIPVANYLPALVLAPAFVFVGRKWSERARPEPRPQ